MAKVGIVICNYNKKDMVLSCIQAILEQKFTDYELFVCDNASTDGSASAIQEAYGDRLTLLKNKENLGGSGGFNTGLRAAYATDCEYLMCVDNDALLDENAVGELVRFLDENPKAGIAASKIYHLEAPDLVQNYGQTIDFQHYCTEVNFLNQPEDGTMPPVVYSDAVPACSLLVRRSVIEKIGFLPEENFLYWDDTEWCVRAREAGYLVASVGASQALHSMGARKEDENTFPTYYAWRNWITFFLRHTPEEKLPELAVTFLNSIFLIQYEGYEGDRYQRAATVMAAYDDALHGVTGKAPDGRIGDIEKTGRDVYCEDVSRLPAEFDKARELFVFSQLPMFLRQARVLREKLWNLT